MMKKLTMNQWLTELGVDLKTPVDLFEANDKLKTAAVKLNCRCNVARSAYSMKVLSERMRRYE